MRTNPIVTTPTPAPAPTPAPTVQTGAQRQAIADAGISLPSVGSGSGSLYNLDSTTSGTKVTVGGLAALLNLPASATADDVVKAFATCKDPAVIAKIQSFLQAGRLYNGSTQGKNPINMGVVTPDDIAAFTDVVKTAAQTGADLSDYLTRQAQFGAYTGLAAALSGSKGVIKTGDPLVLGKAIDDTYQQLTGRKADPSEKAGFIAAYNAAYKQFQVDTAQASAPQTAGNGAYSTAPPAPISGWDGTHFSDHLSSDSPALTATQDQANLTAVPTIPAGGATVQDQFNPQAFAEQYVHEHNTAESDAHDVSSQFDNFLKLIKGI